VIFGPRTPSPGEVDAAHASNACSPPPSSAAAFGTGPGPAAKTRAASGKPDAKPGASAAGPQWDERGPREIDLGVLGTRFERAGDAVKKLHPFLFVLLGMAIALLGIAALPVRMAPNERVASVLEYRRGHIAIAGTMALLVVTVFYVLS
jgi:hypothetical protein